MATENSKLITKFLQQNYGTEFSKHELVEKLGIPLPAVTATINYLIKKKYAETTREEVEVLSEETETRKAVTRTTLYHKLTEAGLSYDPVAEEKAKEEEKRLKAEKRAEMKVAAKMAKEAGE